MQEERSIIIISITVTSIFILLLISFIAFIIYISNNRQIAHQKGLELLKTEFEKTLLSTQLEIQEQTFQNISREIHDNIGLSLTLAKLNLNTIPWQQINLSRNKVLNSVDHISKAIEDLSYISKTLHTDFIEENGLLNALDLEIKKIEKIGLFSLQFEVSGSPVYMNTQKELVIFRIIQEIVNNIIKHAQATNLRLQLNYLDDKVFIEVSDNGKGFNMQQSEKVIKKGTGLMNIIKRANLIGGICEVKSIEGCGTIVRLQIPY